MGKQGKGKAKAPPPSPRKKTRLYQGMLAIAVVGVVGLGFFLGGRNSSSGSAGSSVQSDLTVPPSLRNRLVLPAWPQTPRPVTLPPELFTEPEVHRAYQVAKEIPDVLEHMACYCGCYGSAGHRNNLDCYKDNHGVTWSLCRQIALEAQRQHQMGTPIAEIKRSIDEKWAPVAR